MLEISLQDFSSTGAITVVSVASLVVLLIEALWKESEPLTFWLSVLSLVAGVLIASNGIHTSGTAFGGMVSTGGYADYWAVICCLSTLLSLVLSKSYTSRMGISHGEYYALFLLSVVGMMLMSAGADLVVLFLGLELMSICFYILAGFARTNTSSNEASLKYFLLGAFATGFLLYGIALLYGSTGTTNIDGILGKATAQSGEPLFLIGAALLLVGFGFKVAAVPFHMWVPDVYEGAPTTVTALMATGGKAAAFAAFLLVFDPSLLPQLPDVREVVAAISAGSMILGNLMAVAQSSVKRMLAYSSIAHAGYILTGLVAANEYGSNGVLFYVAAYAVMNVGAFGVVSILERREGGGASFDDFSGLSKSRPALAILMAVFMVSLAGVPPFAGFFGKYYVFAGAVQAGYTWLAIVGVLMSVVSAYYYLRLVVLMYFKVQSPSPEPDGSPLGFVALAISAAALLAIGIYPDALLVITSGLF